MNYPHNRRKQHSMKTDNKQSKFCPPLAERFVKYGDKFEKMACNVANGMYCYRRTTLQGQTYYEVFKAPCARAGNSEIYAYYPTSSQFGFGSALCIRGGGEHVADKIAFYMAHGFDSGRWSPG